MASRAYYTTPLHRQPALQRYAPEQELPGAEQVAATSLALPMGPALTEARSPPWLKPPARR